MNAQRGVRALRIVMQANTIVFTVPQGHWIVCARIDLGHRNIGRDAGPVILLRQRSADATVALLIVNCIDLEHLFALIVNHVEEFELPNWAWRKVLANKTLVLVVSHGGIEGP
jgi:hypothetical protein